MAVPTPSQSVQRAVAPTVGGSELVLSMGPQHPSTHGVLRMVLRLDGETVLEAVPDVGYLHRCFEKLAETWPYPGVVPLTNRNDYLAAIANEQCYTMAVEKLLELELPRRAEYIRVIMAELQRIASHLIWFGTFALDIGATTAFLHAFRERETVYDLFEMATGARLLYSYLRIGGVRRDLPPEFFPAARKFLDWLDKALVEYDDLLTGNRIFEYRTKGIAPLDAATAIAYGASGPVVRGSGVARDVRRSLPYSVYHEFDFAIPTRPEGDAWARYMVRMAEIRQSMRIMRQAMDGIPEGDHMSPKTPRIIRPPAGREAYSAVESPRGEVACYVVSSGGPNAHRVHWRSPCFVHLQLLPLLAPGYKLADLVVIIGSLDIVMGEVDR